MTDKKTDEQLYHEHEERIEREQMLADGYKLKSDDELRDIHREALIAFQEAFDNDMQVREMCRDDRRFCYVRGAQYDGDLGQTFENRPKFEINKVYTHVKRLISEFRKNEVDVTFKPRSEDNKNHKFVADLYREDRSKLSAKYAIDNAIEEGFSGGMGAIRLCHDYADEAEDDKQKIEFEVISDADQRVYFNAGAVLADKSDASKCWLITEIPALEYVEKYEGSLPSSWLHITKRITSIAWSKTKTVMLCDYYRKVHIKDRVVFFKNGIETERRLKSEVSDEERADYVLRGFWEEQGRVTFKEKVEHYILSGEKILEECGYVAGGIIPVVPFYAMRTVIDGVEYISGHVRMARDPAIIKNVMISMLGEIAYTSSNEKPIFTHEQMAGNEGYWADDSKENYKYLLVNSIKNLDGSVALEGPVGYTKPAQVPPALASLIQVAENDLQEILGAQKELNAAPTNISGVALELMQNRLDASSYVMFDNAASFIRAVGERWLAMASEIYVEEGRKVAVLNESGKRQFEEIGAWKKEKDGAVYKANVISKKDFDVASAIVPASQSKKAAATRELRETLQNTADPETQAVITSAILWNYDGEGAEYINEYGRKRLVKAGALEPTDEDIEQAQQQAQNQQPDPNALYLQAAAKEAEAKAVKAQADTELTLAKAGETRAKTAETVAGMDLAERKHTLSVAENLHDVVTKRQSGE